MATRTYAVNPGMPSSNVTEFVGAACTSRFINLTIDIASTVVTEGGSTRAPSREEVINALERIKEYIFRDNSWPPA